MSLFFDVAIHETPILHIFESQGSYKHENELEFLERYFLGFIKMITKWTRRPVGLERGTRKRPPEPVP
jgi:hypothetical protein